MADRRVNAGQVTETRSLPQPHSSELSEQSTHPSHQRSRGTHSWLAHSSSLSWQNEQFFSSILSGQSGNPSQINVCFRHCLLNGHSQRALSLQPQFSSSLSSSQSAWPSHLLEPRTHRPERHLKWLGEHSVKKAMLLSVDRIAKRSTYPHASIWGVTYGQVLKKEQVSSQPKHLKFT